jgi:AcrR family transcriptional regulator
MTAKTEAKAATATVERGDEAGGPTATARPMRADAKRNYELLVTAARKVFDQEGGGASMEAIAKEAGVGIGTLYRHFPKRIDVVEAVYVDDVDELETVAQTVSSDLEPWPAFVAWLEAFVRYAMGKKRFMNELHEAFEKDPDLRSASRERIEGALGIVLIRAQEAGVVRTDVDAADVMQLIGSMCMSATLTTDQGERLLVMIEDGLRPQA